MTYLFGLSTAGITVVLRSKMTSDDMEDELMDVVLATKTMKESIE